MSQNTENVATVISTVEQAEDMEGTEYLHVFICGDSVPAYVKKFNPIIGLTCYSLSPITTKGETVQEVEADGTCCLIGVDLVYGKGGAVDSTRRKLHSMEECFRILTEITTGTYTCHNRNELGDFSGCAFG